MKFSPSILGGKNHPLFFGSTSIYVLAKVMDSYYAASAASAPAPAPPGPGPGMDPSPARLLGTEEKIHPSFWLREMTFQHMCPIQGWVVLSFFCF